LSQYLAIFEKIMKRKILPVLLMLAFISCKKEDNKPTNNLIPLKGTYQSSTTMEVSAPVMYTQSGVITDIAVINKYLVRSKMQNNFSINTNAQTIPADLLNIDIDKNLKVTAKLYLKDLVNKTLNGAVTNQSSTDLLIQANKPDTTITLGGNVINIGYIGTRLNIGKTKPVSSYIPFGSAAGGGGMAINLPQLRLLIKNNDIYLSQLAFYYKFQDSNSYEAGSSFIYDVINPDISKGLLTQDTVVVQQKLVKLVK
jgi:hypothetical protein